MNETTPDLNRKKSNEVSPHFNEIPTEAVRLEFSIHLRGGSETACEFSSDFEIPLGLRQGHQHATLRALGIFFEHAVQIPLMMAARKFLEGRFRQERKENPASTPAAPVESCMPETNFPNGCAGFASPQEALAEFEKMFPPQDEGELPKPPSSFSEPSFPPAVPKTFVTNPPAQPPGNKELKKAA